MIFESILETIGNTPIVKLKKVVKDNPCQIYAKLEHFNPGGSIKDRIGSWLISDAEKKGRLKPGGVVIEATGGNTGIGLAMTAAVKGYKCICTLPDKMSDIKIKSLKAYGATVIVTPTELPPDDPRSYYSVAKQLAKDTPNSIYIDQYNNLANPEYHYLHTGPEIFAQMPDIEVLVAGIGSGGTIVGVGKYLKEQNPNIKIIAVDPKGSIVYETFKYGAPKTDWKSYLIEGIGKESIPKTYDFNQIDDVVQVEDGESFIMTRKILRQEGIFCGVSSGAALVGALRWIDSEKSNIERKKVLIIFADSGDRYISKAYDDDWMRTKNFIQ